MAITLRRSGGNAKWQKSYGCHLAVTAEPHPDPPPSKGEGSEARVLLFDWGGDQAPPLGPGSVVVPDVGIAEQVVQDEPGVGGAFADPAIGDHGLVGSHALRFVEGAELVGGLEGAILANRLAPRDVGGTRNVAAALGALLGQVFRSQQLATELLGRADVDQGYPGFAQLGQHLVAEHPDALHRLAGPVSCRLDRRRFGHQLAAFVLPFLAATVHQPGVLVTVILEVPEEPGGEPVVVFAVDHDRVVVADPLRGKELLELVFRQQVTNRTGLEILAPVETDGALGVPAVVGSGVDVDLDDLDLRVVEMVGHPLGVHQDFRMGVAGLGDLGGGLGHVLLSLKVTNWIHKLNNSGFPSLAAQATKGQLVIRPVEMSEAAQYVPAGPQQPAPRRGRTRLLLVPVGIVVVLLAIPGGTYSFAQNQLSQAQGSEAAGSYKQALSSYATVAAVGGNPVARLLLGDLADHAQTGTAETHFLWGVQLKQQGKFEESETQLRATVKSGIA